MITVRRSDDRGYADHGWLQSFHTFSFASFYDPSHMQFRSLRVMNEDRVAPGQGFGTHSHQNMEIISYVIGGKLEHKDSLGNGSVLSTGEFQCISAGSGIQHSEFNPSSDESVHFYQIWIHPNQQNLVPTYQQKRFDDGQANQFRLVASPDGSDGSLVIHQDARVSICKLQPASSVTAAIGPGRHAYAQVVEGVVRINGEALTTGDGAAISDEMTLIFEADQASEVMLFDLA